MFERTRLFARSAPPLPASGPVRREPPPREPEPIRAVGGVLQELLAPAPQEPAPTIPANTETILEPALLGARLTALAARRAPVLLRTREGVLRGTALPELGPAPYPLQFELLEPVPDTPFALELLGYNSVYHFDVASARIEGRRAAVPFPTSLLRFQHRRTRRADAPQGYNLVLPHGSRTDIQLRRPLIDVSRHGCRVELRSDQDAVRVGETLTNVSIQTPTGLILAFEADELYRIVDLMRHLRGSGARRHVREEIPFYTGALAPIRDLVDRLP